MQNIDLSGHDPLPRLLEEEYVQQERRCGIRVHFHDGVWWKTLVPQYCVPVFQFRQIVPGSARPHPMRSVLGYTHLVPPGATGNGSRSKIVIERPELARFSIKALKSSKRALVRKAHRRLEIRIIRDIDSAMEDMRQINISQARRTGHGLPASYYDEKREQWSRHMHRQFALDKRRWLGAFRGGRLVAYYYYYCVEDVVIVDSCKSHTDYLEHRPNNALLFHTLEDARDAGGIRLVAHGGPSANPSLDQFKAQYMMRPTALPSYSKLSVPARWGRALGTRFPRIVARLGSVLLASRIGSSENGSP